METTMTVKEVLMDVQKVLEDVEIKGGMDFATMVDKVGIPIARAINGIKICVDAIDKQEKADAAKQEQKDNAEPVLELVPAEPEETE